MAETVYELIDEYIGQIDDCLSSSNDSKAFELQNIILAGMERHPLWTYKQQFSMGTSNDFYLRSLVKLKEALRSYKIARQEDEKRQSFSDQRSPQPFITIEQHNNQSQSQQQSMTVSFDQVISWVNDNPSLGTEETAEILAKVKEIQAVAESPEPKKTKWEKMKPFLIWLGNKGVDLAIQVIPLIFMAVK